MNDHKTTTAPDGLDPTTKAEHQARQASRDLAKAKRERREEVASEINRIEAEIQRLRILPPDVERTVDNWTSAIDAARHRFVSDMRSEALKGRCPELRLADRGFIAWLLGDLAKEQLVGLACEVLGSSGTANRQAQAGAASMALMKLKRELATLGG